MAWVVPLCFFSPPGLRRVSKSTGYSIFDLNNMKFQDLYPLSKKKNHQQKSPTTKQIFWGFLIGAFWNWTNPQKRTSPRNRWPARLLDFHPAPRHTAKQRLRPAPSAAGRLAGLAAAGGGGVRCQQDGGEGGGDSKAWEFFCSWGSWWFQVFKKTQVEYFAWTIVSQLYDIF